MKSSIRIQNAWICSRTAISQAFDEACQQADDKTICVDLAEVDFLSRAAAHQILIDAEACEAKGFEVEYVNVGEDPRKMLETVAYRRKHPRPLDDRPISVVNVAEDDDLSDYLPSS